MPFIAHFFAICKRSCEQINKKQCQSSTSKMKSGLLPFALAKQGVPNALLLLLQKQRVPFLLWQKGTKRQSQTIIHLLCFCPSFSSCF
jgi:hypothetical protein